MDTPVVLIYGEDGIRKKKELDKIKADVLANSDQNLNFDRIDGEKDDLNYLQDIVERAPFLGEKRLILIERAPFFGGKCSERVLKYLENYLENPISTSFIVFMAEKVDKRSRLFKQVKKHGEIIQLDFPKQYQVEGMVKERIKELNLNLDKKSLSLLIQNTGGNMGIIEQELNKLASAVGENRTITTDMVEKYVSTTIEANIFKFVDKLGEKDIEPALRHLNEILLLEPVLRVYFMICRQFRLLNLAKILKQEGYSEAQITKELKLPGFVVKKLLAQAEKFTLKELNWRMIELAEMDHALKTSGTQDQKYILEKVVIKSVK